MFFEITGFPQKPTALIQKDEGFRYKRMAGVLGVKDSSGVVVLDFRVVDFLDFTLRLCLSRSVENLLLTSSLALLDFTLPKIRQNDGKGVVILSEAKYLSFIKFFCWVKTQTMVCYSLENPPE